jgi:hypothetical protein
MAIFRGLLDAWRSFRLAVARSDATLGALMAIMRMGLAWEYYDQPGKPGNELARVAMAMAMARAADIMRLHGFEPQELAWYRRNAKGRDIGAS